MATNKHALIRYRTIDRCLKSYQRTYHIKELMEECTDAIKRYTEKKGLDENQNISVSRRTIQYDIKFMKDDELGFDAPILYDKVDGYYYDDPTFELFKTRIDKPDLDVIKEAITSLRHITGKEGFIDFESTLSRIEEAYKLKHNNSKKPIIIFEPSTNISGQRWLSQLRTQIMDKKVINIEYKPFDKEPIKRTISPYCIKEYNNRWFLIGYDHIYHAVTNLGMDRIQSILTSIVPYQNINSFSITEYFDSMIGVSLPDDAMVQKVTFKVYGKRRYYVNTKPIHQSQSLAKKHKEYWIFSIEVIINQELESELFSYGDDLEVLAPLTLRTKLLSRIQQQLSRYKAQVTL